jgi:hypothetical protein
MAHYIDDYRNDPRRYRRTIYQVMVLTRLIYQRNGWPHGAAEAIARLRRHAESISVRTLGAHGHLTQLNPVQHVSEEFGP